MRKDWTLYYNQTSVCSCMVRLLMRELNLTCEKVELDLANGEQLSPWFMRINPLGEVPVLVTADEAIADSQRITDFLAPTMTAAMRGWLQAIHDLAFFRMTFSVTTGRASDGELVAARARDAALHDKSAALAAANPELAAAYQAKEERRRQNKPMVLSPAQQDAVWQHCSSLLDKMEATLSHGDFICGAWSPVDAHATALCVRLRDIGKLNLLKDRPRLWAYFTKMQARPSYAQVYQAGGPTLAHFKERSATSEVTA